MMSLPFALYHASNWQAAVTALVTEQRKDRDSFEGSFLGR